MQNKLPGLLGLVVTRARQRTCYSINEAARTGTRLTPARASSAARHCESSRERKIESIDLAVRSPADQVSKATSTCDQKSKWQWPLLTALSPLFLAFLATFLWMPKFPLRAGNILKGRNFYNSLLPSAGFLFLITAPLDLVIKKLRVRHLIWQTE